MGNCPTCRGTGSQRRTRFDRSLEEVPDGPVTYAEVAERTDASDRVVDAPRNRALAYEKSVGNPVEALEGLVVPRCDRLARAISARHHEDLRRAGLEQEEVYGRIR